MWAGRRYAGKTSQIESGLSLVLGFFVGPPYPAGQNSVVMLDLLFLVDFPKCHHTAVALCLLGSHVHAANLTHEDIWEAFSDPGYHLEGEIVHV